MRRILYLLLLSAFCGTGGLAAGAAPRQAARPEGQAALETAPAQDVGIDAGSGIVIPLSAGAANVFVADPKVAEVRPASARSLFLFGIAPGQTTVAALDAAGHPVAQFHVTVTPSSFGAGQAAAAIHRIRPDSRVRVATKENGLVVSGSVVNAAEAEEAMRIARAYVPDGQSVEDQMRVASAIQVSLRVRVAEMSRTLIEGLGINWSALGSIGRYSVGFGTATTLASYVTQLGNPSALGNAYLASAPNNGANGLIDALAQDNLIHLLAEPTLTTLSGQPASFLVGGEFPIPISQQLGSVSVEFKQYGVTLAFVPTVLSDGRINLKVRPEVSELTDQGAVQLTTNGTGLSIPALIVRRAETTVELGSGQSFAIAGLLQNETTHTSSYVPVLRSLPILGPLFASDSFQRAETELVIVVTPYVVEPTSDPNAIHLPTAGYHAPDLFERLVEGRQTGAGTTPMPVSVPANAGFVVN